MNRTTVFTASRFRVGILGSVLVAFVLALSGCGGSVDDQLVKQTGVHGDQLEIVYALYNDDSITKFSSRKMKDVDAALSAGDLKKATAGDLRRAQDEIQSRIDKLEAAVAKIKKENKKLKATPLPSFSSGLEDSFANKEFAQAYEDVTKNVERYTTTDLAATGLVFNSLEKYLDFLEQWEEFISDDDTSGLVAAGQASDKALAKLNKTGKKMDRREDLSKVVSPLVQKMAAAASDSAQLTTLLDDVRKDYPKNFLSVHVVEKK
ncbi:MAG: hypothetical protein JHC87_00010 [Thermoleophilaceae bacterium]|nr:hypothetical protein [Thermoleophilaceae bacterium]